MADEKRNYRMQRRAESQAQTRLRITESAVELHSSAGPARTSISAVAARAGVRRSTVYRHFPDEAALLHACSAHWLAQNPLPNLAAWAAIDDPDERLHLALRQLHSYYQHAEQMLDNLFRDETTMPLVKESFAAFRTYQQAARDTLMAGRSVRGARRRRTQAALGHAIAYATWKSLARDQQLSTPDAGALLHRLVATAN